MATPVTEITGVGVHSAGVLLEHGYSSAEDIAAATETDLVKVPGFGIARAVKIIAAAQELVQQPLQPTKKKKGKTKTTKKEGIKTSKKKSKKKKAKKTSYKDALKKKKSGKGKGKKKKEKSKKKKD